MQITAKLIELLPVQTGTSQKGDWSKQDIIVETEEQYPRKICISIWGDKIDPDQLVIGNLLQININIESREFNGRWYTDVRAWKIEVVSTNSIPKNDLSTDIKLDTLDADEEDILPF